MSEYLPELEPTDDPDGDYLLEMWLDELEAQRLAAEDRLWERGGLTEREHADQSQSGDRKGRRVRAQSPHSGTSQVTRRMASQRSDAVDSPRSVNPCVVCAERAGKDIYGGKCLVCFEAQREEREAA